MKEEAMRCCHGEEEVQRRRAWCSVAGKEEGGMWCWRGGEEEEWE